MFRPNASLFPFNKLTMMLSLQSTGTFPHVWYLSSKLQWFCSRYQGQLSTVLQQHQRFQPLFHSSCASGLSIRLRSYELCWTCKRINIWKNLRPWKLNIQQTFMLFPCELIWCCQVKDYHHDLVYISLQLHPDFLYVLVWWHERCFLNYLQH